jgi:uncharacterized repeat protein (TIGR03833 family)
LGTGRTFRPGLRVDIVLKQERRAGRLKRGTVREVLTESSQHPHGVKVRPETCEAGRVKKVVEESWASRRRLSGAAESAFPDESPFASK